MARPRIPQKYGREYIRDALSLEKRPSPDEIRWSIEVDVDVGIIPLSVIQQSRSRSYNYYMQTILPHVDMGRREISERLIRLVPHAVPV